MASHWGKLMSFRFPVKKTKRHRLAGPHPIGTVSPRHQPRPGQAVVEGARGDSPLDRSRRRGLVFTSTVSYQPPEADASDPVAPRNRGTTGKAAPMMDDGSSRPRVPIAQRGLRSVAIRSACFHDEPTGATPVLHGAKTPNEPNRPARRFAPRKIPQRSQPTRSTFCAAQKSPNEPNRPTRHFAPRKIPGRTPAEESRAARSLPQEVTGVQDSSRFQRACQE
jgi:hypothetical protein